MKGRKGFVVMAVVAFSVLLMSLPFSAAAWTWNDWDGHHKRSVTYSSPQDFALYFWMEKFQGGRPGAQGNVLFAAGEGFIFQNAVLESVSSLGDGRYQTTYVGGELFLNSDGPWLNRGKLRATDIKATNVSQYAPDFATLTYKLTFDGAFDNDPDLCFSVTADYTGSPNFGLDPSNPIYQKGSVSSTDAFTATITLYHCW